MLSDKLGLKKKSWIGVVVAATLAACLLGAGVAGASGWFAYSVNENGQTYGPAFNFITQEENAVPPDLRAVTASSGKQGYVYTAELNGTLEGLRNMSDADREELDARQAIAFAEAANEMLGTEAVKPDQAAAYLAGYKRSDLQAQVTAD